MRGDLQRINLRVTQLERNNRKLRLQIAKLEKEKLELKGNLMGNKKSDEQFIVGFALETDNEVENAKNKLKGKNKRWI